MSTTSRPRENHREDVAGRANVEDTPELLADYDELEGLGAGALWTVANKIEPWEPVSQSVPMLWRYRDLRAHVLRSVDLVTPEKAGRRVIYLENPGRRDVGNRLGQRHGRRVGGLEEQVVVRQLAHLPGRGLDQLLAAIAQVDAPEPGHGVEDLVAFAVPQIDA